MSRAVHGRAHTGRPALWRWVLGYALRRRAGLLLLGAVMVLEACVQSLAPWPMKALVDQALRGEPAPSWLGSVLALVPGAGSREGLLAWCVAATIILFILVALLGVAQAGLGAAVGQRLSYDLAADVFAHLQRLSLRAHSRRSVGDLMRRVTGDCGSVATIIRDALLPSLAAALTLVIAFAMMVMLDLKLALVALLALPLLTLVVRRYTSPILERGYEYAQAESEIWDVIEQTLTAVPAIQAFSAEREADRRVGAAYQGVLSSAVSLTRAQFRLKVLSGLVAAVLSAAMIWIGSHEVQSGALSLGGLLVFLSYLAMLYGPLDSITHSMGSATEAAGAARRVIEILGEQQEVVEAPSANTLAVARDGGDGVTLEFSGVTWGYEAGRSAVEGVTIRIPRGATVALVGPSGAGKSTLASMVPRLCDPWEGAVLLDGRDIRDYTLRSLRDHVAMVLQETFLFPASIADNIAYGRPGAGRGEIERAARDAGAHEFIMRLPEEYDTVIGERGATLSGGERQRLAIARALLKDAPVLVLDEPTSALDSTTEQGILAAMDRLRKGRTTLLIAHRLSTVRGADRIIVLDRGRVAEEGTHDELRGRAGLYARLWHLQSGGQRSTHHD
jgi:ABC-type multidrug transport system fused ATPase/permease subunit